MEVQAIHDEGFAKAVAFVLRWEGGFSDHPDDPGGATRYGITQARFPEVDLDRLTREGARDLYRKHYWKPLGCRAMEEPLALVLLDTGVNLGVGRAGRFLQSGLNRLFGPKVRLAEDGRIGPRTLAALESARGDWPGADGLLAREVLLARVVHYADLGTSRRFRPFLRGWINRAAALARSI